MSRLDMSQKIWDSIPAFLYDETGAQPVMFAILQGLLPEDWPDFVYNPNGMLGKSVKPRALLSRIVETAINDASERGRKHEQEDLRKHFSPSKLKNPEAEQAYKYLKNEGFID